MSNIKSRKYYEDYSIEEITNISNPFRFLAKETKFKTPAEDNQKNSDDELRTKTWTELYKTAAYYLDNPDPIRREKMFKHIRANFSDVLAETINPNELPLVQNRNTLLNWVCNKNNEFLEKKNSSKRVVCDVKALLQVFGPNYQAAEEYLGSIRHSI